MQESIISWTNQTWNPASGCSKVSDGCKFCYAMTLSLRYGWTSKPWTIQNEAENVVLKPHKLHEPYKLGNTPQRVFVNSMSDLGHGVIPDWYRAVVFCIMLDLPQHVFQVLTKRPETFVDWHIKFHEAVASDDFKQFTETVKDKRVKAALLKKWDSPWASNVWMGTSVEDHRVTHRVDTLRKCKAHIRFLSCEPLIGSLGMVDLTGIHWVIVGGESGTHMTAGNERWMKQEWAREIRDRCVNQEVAFFYKQDSGVRTEMRPYLVEEDGSRWKWEQIPGDLKPAVNIDTGEQWEPKTYRAYRAGEFPDYDWGGSRVFIPPQMVVVELVAPHPETLIPTPVEQTAPVHKTKVVKFQDVKQHWNPSTREWDSDEYVYIGRWNGTYNLPQSPFHNPFKLTVDTPENRAAVLEQYRTYITDKINRGLLNPGVLYGKILVCHCKPKACHGDILLDVLHPTAAAHKNAYNELKQPEQLALF
jgi:protein gp37